MREKTRRMIPGVFVSAAILSALLASGCPKQQEIVFPTTEGKAEPAEAAKPQPMSPPPGPQPVEKPASPTPVGSQHPVLSGETVLDPAVPHDAKMIQTRLADLGLYKGKIDGVWGRNSRAALKSFKEKSGLSDPERWDKETQIQLFLGVSLAPQPASGVSLTPISSGETLLDPAVPHDAKLIQTRLAELGLYRGTIDGVWGRNSRAALRAFKEKHSLADPEAWDRDTQILLFRETGK
jgi:peptidoglycan hydrolase-like protein with peptidoglycan-binding domain